MLQRLYIRNYAIIEELDIHFPSGLNVITGETGAGKSILLGALSLILGERADKEALSDKHHKAIVEGVFQLPDTPAISEFFRENELDHESQTLIRREISAQGKSRAFINDTPVNLQQLGHLASLLVDLHQQFDTLQIGRADFQLEVLDALAGHQALLEDYRQTYHTYRDKKNALKALRLAHERQNREQDYDQFLFDELQDAAFRDNELEDLETELETLTHAEELKAGLAAAGAMMEEDETAIVPALRQVEGKLQAIAGFHPEIAQLMDRLRSAAIELADIAADLQHLSGHVSFDEERIQFIEARLDAGYKLYKKHGVQTTAELIAIRDRLQDKLDALSHATEDLEQLETETKKLRGEAEALAEKLSAGRQRHVAGLIKKTNALLKSVGMPSASIRVEITAGELAESGRDRVTFLFDANKSGNYQPLGKVASGGELSRLMLCVKSLVARSVALPTLIFDEIDSGISGEAARQVGNILKDLAGSHQILCITHQPQIAGKAATHFEVVKQEKDGHITTRVRLLDHEARITTIARMLSGEQPGEAALANARELMED